MSSQEVIEAIKNQNSTIERRFYQENKQYCIQYAMRSFFWKQSNGNTIRCAEEDAEELYNDACIVFIQNVLRGRIHHLKAQMTTYLITAMRYSWMNKARAMKVTPQIVAADADFSTQEATRLNVRKAINQLDIKCREMMTYRYILGWEDYDDIAKATGKNNGDVVRNLISRCRKRFREHYVQLTKLSGV